MEKYVDCHNCQNQYDCERTYLGGCTDGKEWEQEEKKLTDDEIVKALGNCQKNNCIDCPYFIDEHSCKANVLLADTLDLIRRLQYAYSSASKASEEWKAKYEAERKENAEQKAEIERLVKVETELQELNAKYYNEAKDLRRENAELQKQVDELKKENQRLSDLEFTQEHCDLYQENEYLKECLVLAKEQAVKDTAREIFTDLLKEFSIRKSCGNADVVVREMASRKGVEVE